MWRTELINSIKQYLFVSLFYILLILVAIYAFFDTLLDNLTFIIVVLLVYEWWRSCCYFKTMRGELALFYQQNELYWSRQRWRIIKTPLFFRYAVIVHLVSRKNGKRRILFLMDDSFSRQDWRSLNYFLRYIRYFQ